MPAKTFVSSSEKCNQERKIQARAKRLLQLIEPDFAAFKSYYANEHPATLATLERLQEELELFKQNLLNEIEGDKAE